MHKIDLWLIGSGNNAIDYLNVLNELDVNTIVVGNSKSSCDRFYLKTKLKPLTGGLYNNLKVHQAPKSAIVSVSIEQLFKCTKLLIQKGCKNILVEKPGALEIKELLELKKLKDKFSANLWIAYNRRFYKSVRLLKKLSDEDGGIKSLFFEFTELSSLLENPNFKNHVKEKTLLWNSSHVIDLAFNLIGEPKKDNWQFYNSGNLKNHKSSSRFNGAGTSQKNIPFTYHADWECPGRWGVDVMTKNNRFILRPLEKLQVISKGSMKAELVYCKKNIEDNFKPGFYQQCKEFLYKDFPNLKSIEDQIDSFQIYNKIAGYL